MYSDGKHPLLKPHSTSNIFFVFLLGIYYLMYLQIHTALKYFGPTLSNSKYRTENKYSRNENKGNEIEYCWAQSNMGVKVANPPASWKSTYNFGFPRNFTTISLLLTKSLTDNTKSITTYFVCYMYHILHSYSKVS